MTNRVLLAVLLLSCAFSVTAHAQSVHVLSHANVENGFVVPSCQTKMNDQLTIDNYPAAEAFCTLNQNAIPQITFSCSHRFNAFCSLPNEIPVIEGADYQTATDHELVTQQVTCFDANGNPFTCNFDPLLYGYPVGSTLIPQVQDFGDIPAGLGSGGEFFAGNQLGGNDITIADSAETQFQTAQVVPVVLHVHANQDPTTTTFQLNGFQNANWTFVGSSGTTTPIAPSQGPTIQFNAPNTVPVQQQDTITGCKVDTSHGTDCNSAQIIVEVLGVTIPPSDYTVTPFFNPDELLGGQSVQYKATVTQGAQVVNLPVTWTKTAETSGGSFVDVNADGTVTVQPQSAFQGNDFTVDIQATSPFDPKVAISGPFSIHVPTATVQMKTVPVPGPSESTSFLATANRSFDFDANVTGPLRAENRVVKWDQNNNLNLPNPGEIKATPTLTNPNSMSYVISIPPFPGVNIETVNIIACAREAGQPVNVNLAGTQCATFPLKLSAPVFPTSPPQRISSGESTPVTITGTGFGAAPTLSFSDPGATFTLTSVSGPDANGVTTVQGTMTAAPIAVGTIIPLTITSSMPPPSTPVNQSVAVRPVTTTPAVAPVNPTLIISQSQQFTASLGCVTFSGLSCTVPQTSTCSLISGPGTISTGCLYTAPASLAAQTQVQAQACFTFGNVCKTFSINLVPVGVAVAPAAASLDSAQSQQFLSTVTNVPNNNQATNWSVSPAVGTISATGLYTAPAVVTALQTVTVTGCSAVDSLHCASATVTLNPVAVAISPSTPVTLGQGQTQQFQATVTHSPSSSVVWSLSAAVGSISSAGLYTAPPTVTSNQTVTVKACSSIAPGNCGTAQVNLIPPDFALSVSPSTGQTGLAIQQGFTVSVNSIGAFAGTVTLSATVPPNGMSATFSPATIAGSGTSVVHFPVTSSTPGGSYTVTITGTSGGLVHSAQITVTVLVESMTITVSAPQTAAAGTTVTFTFNVTNNNFFAQDGITYGGIPPGSTITPTAWGGSGPGSLTFTTPTTLSPGTYPITVTATAGSLTASATTSLTIPAPTLPPPPDPGGCLTQICP